MTTPRRRRAGPEKGEERKGRMLMAALDFTCWHLSKAGPTEQTPGWPDMKFTSIERALAVWWEAKSESGKQTGAQRDFERHVRACGEEYVVGTVEALAAWCEGQGLVKVLPSGAWEIPRMARDEGGWDHG